jgi:two-component system, OmpR family, response regulator
VWGSAAVCFAEECGSELPAGRPKLGDRPSGEVPAERHLKSVKKQTGRRVLVVDDEPSMRLLCSINLRLAGFEVSEAADGTEALEQAEAEEFDLVLLDVMLPDIGGHEVARRWSANERTRALPVVFLSARTDRDDLRAGYELGAVDYITKPFDPIALAARVDEVLDRVARDESESYRRARLAELEG